MPRRRPSYGSYGISEFNDDTYRVVPPCSASSPITEHEDEAELRSDLERWLTSASIKKGIINNSSSNNMIRNDKPTQTTTALSLTALTASSASSPPSGKYSAMTRGQQLLRSRMASPGKLQQQHPIPPLRRETTKNGSLRRMRMEDQGEDQANQTHHHHPNNKSGRKKFTFDGYDYGDGGDGDDHYRPTITEYTYDEDDGDLARPRYADSEDTGTKPRQARLLEFQSSMATRPGKPSPGAKTSNTTLLGHSKKTAATPPVQRPSAATPAGPISPPRCHQNVKGTSSKSAFVRRHSVASFGNTDPDVGSARSSLPTSRRILQRQVSDGSDGFVMRPHPGSVSSSVTSPKRNRRGTDPVIKRHWNNNDWNNYNDHDDRYDDNSVCCIPEETECTGGVGRGSSIFKETKCNNNNTSHSRSKSLRRVTSMGSEGLPRKGSDVDDGIYSGSNYSSDARKTKRVKDAVARTTRNPVTQSLFRNSHRIPFAPNDESCTSNGTTGDNNEETSQFSVPSHAMETPRTQGGVTSQAETEKAKNLSRHRSSRSTSRRGRPSTRRVPENSDEELGMTERLERETSNGKSSSAAGSAASSSTKQPVKVISTGTTSASSAFNAVTKTSSSSSSVSVLRKTNSVKLHVYDLVTTDTQLNLFGCHFPLGQCFSALNTSLHTLGTGAYHVGIEINGIEYAYGANSTKGLTGVFTCIPKHSPGYQYRTTIDFGHRLISRPPSHEGGRTSFATVPLDGREIIREMADEYMGTDYDLLRKNCCTFAHDACIRLGVNKEEIPSWFNNLAAAGALTQDAAQFTMAPFTQVFTSCEMDKFAQYINDHAFEEGFGTLEGSAGGRQDQIVNRSRRF